MPERIILPTAEDIIAPVIAKIIDLRPNSAPYLNDRTGAYWHPVLGYRGQAARMLQRLSLMTEERRLNTATGNALLDYVASEFDTVPQSGRAFAEGSVTLGYGTDSNYPGGVFPAGTRITRSRTTVLGVTYAQADYELLLDAAIDASATATVTVPVRSIRDGQEANHPLLVNGSSPKMTVPNLVQNVVVTAFEAGGGSDGPGDDYVRRFAKAYSLGQYGPSYAESLLGGLSANGVSRVLAYDVPTSGTAFLIIGDSSWGSSSRWADVVKQNIYDNDFVGFGCKVGVGRIRNRVISVEAEVSLRDATYTSDTSEVDQAIQTAVKSYFDDRLDWNVWNTSSLRGIVTRAHPKVYACTSIAVKDAATDIELSEITTPDFSEEQLHYLMPSNAVKITYSGPS